MFCGNKMVLWLAVIVLCCYINKGLIFAYTLQDEQTLHSALLTGYNKGLRPGIDRTIPMTLNMTFLLFSIKEFDMSTGEFSVTGVFVLDRRETFLESDKLQPNKYDSDLAESAVASKSHQR